MSCAVSGFPEPRYEPPEDRELRDDPHDDRDELRDEPHDELDRDELERKCWPPPARADASGGKAQSMARNPRNTKGMSQPVHDQLGFIGYSLIPRKFWRNRSEKVGNIRSTLASGRRPLPFSLSNGTSARMSPILTRASRALR